MHLRTQTAGPPAARLRPWPARAPALALVAALAGPPAGGAAQPVLEIGEAEVLAAVIAHGRSPENDMLVLAAETSGDPAALASSDDTLADVAAALAVPEALIRSWARRNLGSIALDRPLALGIEYRLLSRADLAELFDGTAPVAGWERFFARYAGAPGLLRVSRPGFDDHGLDAVVYVELQCGAECGAGRLVHLDRAGGTWQVRNAVLVWMTE